MEIIGTRRSRDLAIDWTPELKNIQNDHCKLKIFEETPEDFFDNLPFQFFEIEEESTTEQKLLKVCCQLKSGKHEIGSKYSGNLNDNGDALWDRLKEELQVEHSSKTNFASETNIPNCELLVEKEKAPTSTTYTFKAQIVRSGTWESKQKQPEGPTQAVEPLFDIKTFEGCVNGYYMMALTFGLLSSFAYFSRCYITYLPAATFLLGQMSSMKIGVWVIMRFKDWENMSFTKNREPEFRICYLLFCIVHVIVMISFSYVAFSNQKFLELNYLSKN